MQTKLPEILEKVTPTTTQPTRKYEAWEHQHIGNEAMKAFLNKDDTIKRELSDIIDPDTFLITLNPKYNLTAGEWISLPADFYAIPHAPISGLPNEQGIPEEESQFRFVANYETLANIKSEEGIEELRKIRAAMREEEKLVKETIARHGNVARTLHDHASAHHKKYASLTAKNIITKFLALNLPSAITGLTVYTRYLEIAAYNFDHFGPDAKIAFEAGYAVACKTAKLAYATKLSGNNDAAKNLLARAITQALFACHYLTDSFASGHMRVPRKELVRHTQKIKLGGALSLMMHNEDGEQGLLVKHRGKKGESEIPWESRGDGCMYDDVASLNRSQVINATTLVIESIYQFYAMGQANEFNFEENVPVPLPDNDNKHPPLFKVNEKGAIELRDPLHLPEKNTSTSAPQFKYSSHWNPYTTMAKLWFLNKVYKPEDYNHITAEDIEREIKKEFKENDAPDTTSEQLSHRSCTLL